MCTKCTSPSAPRVPLQVRRVFVRSVMFKSGVTPAVPSSPTAGRAAAGRSKPSPARRGKSRPRKGGKQSAAAADAASVSGVSVFLMFSCFCFCLRIVWTVDEAEGRPHLLTHPTLLLTVTVHTCVCVCVCVIVCHCLLVWLPVCYCWRTPAIDTSQHCLIPYVFTRSLPLHTGRRKSGANHSQVHAKDASVCVGTCVDARVHFCLFLCVLL